VEGRSVRATVAALWLASALTSGSTWVMQVTVFVHVLQHSTTAALAGVELVGTLPSLIFMPFAGAIADRADPRVLAVVSTTAQAASVAALALVVDKGLGLVAATYGAQGLAATLWAPARQRWLYRSLPERRWPAANAALGSVAGVTTVAGAALGGVLSTWSTTGALAVAASLQLAALAALAALAVLTAGGKAPEEHASPGPGTTLWAELREGLREAGRLPLARSVIWIGVAWGFIGGAYDVLLAGDATTVLHGGGLTLGALYVVDGVAVMLGAVLVARIASRRHLGAYALAYIVQGAAWGALFLATSLAPAAALLALMRVASGVIIGLDTTILLAAVPARLRGRVLALHMTSYGAVARLSLAVFGGLLAVVDLRTIGVAAGCASALVGVIWWVLAGRRRGAADPLR
jgi:hypothetical protein